MPYQVQATPVAQRAISGLRGARLTKYEAFERDVAAAGCAAMGYRLTGEAPLPSLCVKNLSGKDRVVAAFVEDVVWVLLVGPHEAGDRAVDVYSRLYELCGLEPPQGERTKPPCCGPTGTPPSLSKYGLDLFLARRR